MFPEEIPGRCCLSTPIVREGTVLIEIELWQRCLPDNMICRCGDLLVLDVVYYKREKIYFARSVRLLEYEPLGREVGTVIRVRDGENYGFLRSDMRENNVYFRLRDVSIDGPDGIEAAKPEHIQIGSALAFNLLVDESHGGNKLKGIRLHILKDGKAIQSSARKILIAERCEGIIVREANKEQSGQLKLKDSSSASLADYQLLQNAYHDYFTAVQRFIDCPYLKELTIENLLNCQRKALYEILDALQNSISHELLDITPGQSSLGAGIRSLRLRKLSAEDFQIWRNSNQAETTTPEEPRDLVNFTKADADERCGPLMKDSVAVCDIFFDRRVGRLIGRGVVVKEEIPLDAIGEQRGVVAVVKSKTPNSRYGLLRVHPTNEKVFWHSSCVLNGLEVCEGMEVAFLLRIRNGLRCAIDITPTGGLNREEVVDGLVEAVVLEGGKAIIMKTGECPQLQNVYNDLDRAVEMVKKGDAELWTREASSSTPVPDENNDHEPKSMQFFTPVARTPIPFESDGHEPTPGSVVWCRAIMNWVVSIAPVRLNVVEILNVSAKRYRGVVNRVKVRGGGTLLTELKKDALLEDGQPVEGWLPDADDIICYSEETLSRRRALHIGDLVEFRVFPNSAIAFELTEHRGGGSEEGLVFRKSVNSALKGNAAKPAANTVVMAEGPPEDNAIGFKSGWRELPQLEGLSWSHLLLHLQ